MAYSLCTYGTLVRVGRILTCEKWAVHQLSLSLVTVPVTSVVCVAAINLACPNLARYYFALYSPPAYEWVPSQLGYIFHRSSIRFFDRYTSFYYHNHRYQNLSLLLNKKTYKIYLAYA